MLREYADNFLNRFGERLAILAAFLIPVKLSLSLIVVIPLTIATILSSRLREFRQNALVQSLLLFFIFAAVAAFFGIRPAKSIKEIFGLMFYSAAFIPFYFAARRRWCEIILALLCGQALAGLHSVADSALNWEMPRFFPGRVTESGQLAIAMFGLSALFLNSKQNLSSGGKLFAVLTFIGLLICGFSYRFVDPAASTAALIAISGVVVWSVFLMVQYWLGRDKDKYLNLLLFITPILLAALTLNLKRGPWAGVFFGAGFLLWHKRRGLILPILLAGIGVVVGIAPIRDRLLESSENFFIKGGRNTIWETALDVSVRFPLGVGVGNAGVLRDFAPDVPEGLSHFHSNPLNILAETGWVGLALFAAFIVKCIHRGMEQVGKYSGALVVAVVACWQIAGLVEYNIGDTEVLLALVAILGALTAKVKYDSADSSPC
jgi:hypothetical protein